MRFLKKLVPFVIIAGAALLLLYLPDIGPERYTDLGGFFKTERKRQAYVDAETKRLAAAGGGDAFDQKVLEMIASQAERKGIRYAKPAGEETPGK